MLVKEEQEEDFTFADSDVDDIAVAPSQKIRSLLLRALPPTPPHVVSARVLGKVKSTMILLRFIYFFVSFFLFASEHFQKIFSFFPPSFLLGGNTNNEKEYACARAHTHTQIIIIIGIIMGDGTTYRKSLSIPKAALLAVVCFLIGFLTGGAKLDYHNGNGDTTATMKTQKDVDGEDPSPGALRNARIIEIYDDETDEEDLGEGKPVVKVKEAKNSVASSSEDSNAIEKVGPLGDGYLTELKFQLLSTSPRSVMYRNFASDADCDAIVEAAKTRLHRSGLALKRGETLESTKNIRTSSGTFLASKEEKSGALKRVEEKMARATHIPASHGEAYNVLRYEIGQKYDSHYDMFDPLQYGPQKSQRVASFLLYLTTPDEGGETVFPLEGEGGMKRLHGIDYTSCEVGLKVKPRKGDALLFWSVHPNNTFDRSSLHGGCPVVSGTKFVATKWIHDNSFAI